MNPVISKRRKWTSQENKIVMKSYLLSESKIRTNKNSMLSLWLQKGRQSADHKNNARCLQDLQSEVNVKKQENIDLTTGSLKRILRRMPNWKSPGPHLVQEFWLKNFSSLHERV